MLKKSYNGTNGYTVLCEKGKSSLSILEFGILSLENGQRYTIAAEEKETALIILSGRGAFRTETTAWETLGKRRDVFSGPACSLFVPRRNVIEVTAKEKLNIAVVRAPSDIDGVPVLIRPEDVIIKKLGKYNWAREAHFIIDERIPAKNLYIGEAFVSPGSWASYPPHKHDVDDMPDENFSEEIYFYRFNMPQGFGIQRVYTENRELDETYVVENNDVVEIPRGYHPFASAPGYYAYYLWIMGGENRGFYMSFQKEHSWINALDTFLTKNQ